MHAHVVQVLSKSVMSNKYGEIDDRRHVGLCVIL
jgi:hypothetical protein